MKSNGITAVELKEIRAIRFTRLMHRNGYIRYPKCQFSNCENKSGKYGYCPECVRHIINRFHEDYADSINEPPHTITVKADLSSVINHRCVLYR